MNIFKVLYFPKGVSVYHNSLSYHNILSYSESLSNHESLSYHDGLDYHKTSCKLLSFESIPYLKNPFLYAN